MNKKQIVVAAIAALLLVSPLSLVHAQTVPDTSACNIDLSTATQVQQLSCFIELVNELQFLYAQLTASQAQQAVSTPAVTADISTATSTQTVSSTTSSYTPPVTFAQTAPVATDTATSTATVQAPAAPTSTTYANYNNPAYVPNSAHRVSSIRVAPIDGLLNACRNILAAQYGDASPEYVTIYDISVGTLAANDWSDLVSVTLSSDTNSGMTNITFSPSLQTLDQNHGDYRGGATYPVVCGTTEIQ